MNEMRMILTVIILIIIQALFDFLIWFGIYKEQSGHRFEWIFRVIKFILDFPVTIYLSHYVFGINWFTLEIFYLLKWVGWCDAVYILIWKLFNRNKNYTQDDIWWLWWTPLGLARTRIKLDDFCDVHFLKGVMSLQEFVIQLSIGLAFVYPVALIIKIIVKLLYNIILKLF